MSYSTRQINIASFLYSQNIIKLVGIDRSDPNNVHFFFEPQEKAQQLVDDYFSGKAKCDPRELFARLSDLKDLIFLKTKL